MEAVLACVLIGISLLLFIAVRRKWIHNDSIQLSANIGSIVALLVSIFILIFPNTSIAKLIPWNKRGYLYMERFDNIDTSKWNMGRKGSWNFAWDDGHYIMENVFDDNAIHYIYLGTDNIGSLINEPVSVDVKAEFGDSNTSCVGMLYRFDLSSKYYYAFTICPGDRITIFKRNPKGLIPLYTSVSETLRQDGFNKLAVEGYGDKMSFYVNDWLLTEIVDGEIQGTESGIVGIGTGKFFYDNVIIYDK